MSDKLLSIQYNKENAEKLYKLCEPLCSQCGIKIFGYRKFFINGQYLALCNHHKWQDFYFVNIKDLGTVFSTAIQKSIHKKFTYFLWPQVSNDFIISALHSFNIWNGITIYYRENDFVESFAFAGDISDTQIPNFIINNTKFVEEFILYIRSKAQRILTPLDEDVLGHFKEIKDLTCQENNLKLNAPSLEQDLYFMKENKVKKFTNKESKCISGLAKGLTYKCIAKELSISEKTVETHINNIRSKIGHYSKSDLAKIYHENKKMFLIYK